MGDNKPDAQGYFEIETRWNIKIQLSAHGLQDLIVAYRQWSGLMAGPDEKPFFEACLEAFESGDAENIIAHWYADHWQKVDLSFEKQRKEYVVTPIGNTLAIARKLFFKYAPVSSALWERHQDMIFLGAENQ